MPLWIGDTMPGAFEQTIIIGNVGNVRDLSYTQSGAAVMDFSVAIDKSYTPKDGERVNKTKWIKVVCWRGLAEVCSKYVKKGMSVMVTGDIDGSAYMGQDGQPKFSLELTARDVQFLMRSDNAGQSANDDDAPQENDTPF